MTSDTFHEPWRSFLRDLDESLSAPTDLHCLGGFVISQAYGLGRTTVDVDVFEALGTDAVTLARLAGNGSDLHKRHKVYLDIVTVASVPEHYASRLIDMPSESFRNLRLRGFERHDLVLAKLARNGDRDLGNTGVVTPLSSLEFVDALHAACPCDAAWKNHGQYVSCVSKEAKMLSPGERGELVSQAAQTACGK